jgi:hypothetical protein
VLVAAVLLTFTICSTISTSLVWGRTGQVASHSALTISDSSSTNRKAMFVPDIVFEPSNIPLPPVNGTQAYQVTSLAQGVEFINYFTESSDASTTDDAVVWEFDNPSSPVQAHLGDWMLTNQRGKVWIMDEANFEAWLDRG